MGKWIALEVCPYHTGYRYWLPFAFPVHTATYVHLEHLHVGLLI